MKHIDWVTIQKYYDDNHFWSEILKEFKISSSTLAKAVKQGKIKMRTVNESMSIKHKLNPRKLSENTKKKISESRIKYLKENPDRVPYLINHSSNGETYPEKYFREILEKKNLDFEPKYPFSIYELDFAFITKSINLEIDGSQHKYDLKIVKSNKKETILCHKMDGKL